jgi:L-lactate dehydrogenase
MGNVGATFAYALLLSGLAAEIEVIDVNHAKAEGEAMDLNHTEP